MPKPKHPLVRSRKKPKLKGIVPRETRAKIERLVNEFRDDKITQLQRVAKSFRGGKGVQLEIEEPARRMRIQDEPWFNALDRKGRQRALGEVVQVIHNSIYDDEDAIRRYAEKMPRYKRLASHRLGGLGLNPPQYREWVCADHAVVAAEVGHAIGLSGGTISVYDYSNPIAHVAAFLHLPGYPRLVSDIQRPKIMGLKEWKRKEKGKFHVSGGPQVAYSHILRNMSADFQDEGRWKEGETALREAIQLNPHYPGFMISLGRLLMNQWRTNEAITAFKTAIKLDGRNHRAYNAIGICSAQSGRLKDAEAAFRKAAKMEPEDPVYRNNLGLSLVEQRGLEEAERQFRKAVELEPHHLDYRENLIAVLNNQGKTDEATKLMQELGKMKKLR